MPFGHRLQASRFELKYVIPEELVRPLREFASGYLAPDEHADPARNWEYEVHSLYLDSPSLTLCRATMHGLKNRYKLRIRFYDEKPESPAYFEIKRRVSDVILKQRAAIRRSAVPRLLAGQWPDRVDLVNDNDAAFGAIEEFCSLRYAIGADGQVFVSYLREAYVTPEDNSVRMTFDRRLAARPYEHNFTLSGSREPLYPDVGGVVLELKFTDRFPNWMRDMVEGFDLERVSMAKYVHCVEAMASRPMRSSPVGQELRV